MLTYSLDFIFNIERTKYQIGEHTLACLKEIETLVGAPNYIRTPRFKNYENKKWENFRNFKKTIIVNDKADDIEKTTMEVRELLNKLTTKTYDNIKDKMCDRLKDMNDETLQKLCPIIFQISSGNMFFSLQYATLFKVLIEKHPLILTLFRSNFSKFLDVFKNIKYVGSSNNYDEYCRNNKLNEKRKALSSFFSNLLILEVIPNINILKIVLILQQKINTVVNDDADENNVSIIEEIVENICIIMNIISKKIDKDDVHLKLILQNMKWVLENEKQYKSITNKTIFKYMDILDNLNIEY